MTTSSKLPELVSSMSMITATGNLFWAKPQKYEVFVFDAAKTFMIVGSIIPHCLVCAEIPLGYYLIGKLNMFNTLKLNEL